MSRGMMQPPFLPFDRLRYVSERAAFSAPARLHDVSRYRPISWKHRRWSPSCRRICSQRPFATSNSRPSQRPSVVSPNLAFHYHPSRPLSCRTPTPPHSHLWVPEWSLSLDRAPALETPRQKGRPSSPSSSRRVTFRTQPSPDPDHAPMRSPLQHPHQFPTAHSLPQLSADQITGQNGRATIPDGIPPDDGEQSPRDRRSSRDLWSSPAMSHARSRAPYSRHGALLRFSGTEPFAGTSWPSRVGQRVGARPFKPF